MAIFEVYSYSLKLNLLENYPQLLPQITYLNINMEGKSFDIPYVSVHFKKWDGKNLADAFGGKPVIKFKNTGMFAELAILQIFRDAGWEGKWIETYPSPKNPKYYSSWNDTDKRVEQLHDPIKNEIVLRKLEEISKANGNTHAGCWDVMVWKNDQLLFIESKRKSKDKIQSTQLKWLDAAMKSGLTSDNFLLFEWDFVDHKSKMDKGEVMTAEHFKKEDLLSIDEYVYQEILTPKLEKLTASSDFDQNVINEIVLWKVNRYVDTKESWLNELNSFKDDDSVKESKLRHFLESLLDKSAKEGSEKIEKNVHGVGIAMASTFLRFRNPKLFQIIDERTFRVIIGEFRKKHKLISFTKTDDQINLYVEYLKKLRTFCDEKHIRFETADKEIYRWDKEMNGDFHKAKKAGKS